MAKPRENWVKLEVAPFCIEVFRNAGNLAEWTKSLAESLAYNDPTKNEFGARLLGEADAFREKKKNAADIRWGKRGDAMDMQTDAMDMQTDAMDMQTDAMDMQTDANTSNDVMSCTVLSSSSSSNSSLNQNPNTERDTREEAQQNGRSDREEHTHDNGPDGLQDAGAGRADTETDPHAGVSEGQDRRTGADGPRPAHDHSQATAWWAKGSRGGVPGLPAAYPQEADPKSRDREGLGRAPMAADRMASPQPSPGPGLPAGVQGGDLQGVAHGALALPPLAGGSAGHIAKNPEPGVNGKFGNPELSPERGPGAPQTVDPSQCTPRTEIVAQGAGLARRRAKAVLDSPNDPEFALWWAAYPRKEGKSISFVAWEKTRRIRPAIDAMLATLGWQRESQNWKKDGGQYIPMPATYLNQGRWADEPPPRAPTWEEQMQASYDEINERHRALGAKC